MRAGPRGFAFPFQVGIGGGIRLLGGAEKIKQNIEQALLTHVGERIMLREYGGNLRHLLGDPNNDALVLLARHQIVKVIQEHEPRAWVRDVYLSQDEARLTVSVHFTVRQTQEMSEIRFVLEGT